jgi:hypothetical protein
MSLWRTLICALAIAGPAGAQDAYQPPWPEPGEDHVAWQIEHIDAAAAMLVWSDPDVVVALERETLRRDGSTARAWFRWDALNQGAATRWGGRSLLQLREADCVRRRARMVALSLYPGNNLSGLPTSSDMDHAEWSYDRPGMMGAALTAAMCEGVMLFSEDDVARWMDETLSKAQ